MYVHSDKPARPPLPAAPPRRPNLPTQPNPSQSPLLSVRAHRTCRAGALMLMYIRRICIPAGLINCSSGCILQYWCDVIPVQQAP